MPGYKYACINREWLSTTSALEGTGQSKRTRNTEYNIFRKLELRLDQAVSTKPVQVNNWDSMYIVPKFYALAENKIQYLNEKIIIFYHIVHLYVGVFIL